MRITSKLIKIIEEKVEEKFEEKIQELKTEIEHEETDLPDQIHEYFVTGITEDRDIRASLSKFFNNFKAKHKQYSLLNSSHWQNEKIINSTHFLGFFNELIETNTKFAPSPKVELLKTQLDELNKRKESITNDLILKMNFEKNFANFENYLNNIKV